MSQASAVLFLSALFCALVGSSCSGRLASGESGPEDVLMPGRLVLSPGAVVSPNYRATFRTLEDAIRSEDEDLAGAILDRLDASPLNEQERELASNLRRVLKGRQLARSIELELTIAPAETVGDWELSLTVSQDQAKSLVLRLPPVRLTHRRHRLDELGVGSQEARTLLLPVFEELELPRGEAVQQTVSVHAAPMRAAVAMRDEWTLELLAGSIEADGEALPAAAFPQAHLERVYLASFFPTAPLEPAELVAYASREDPAVAPLIERAVRIPPAHHDAALDALEPLLLELLQKDPDRVVKLAPALRWLARTNAPGVDAAAWVRYIRARRERQEDERREAEREQRRLDIPNTGRDEAGSGRRGSLSLPTRSTEDESEQR